MLVFRKYSILPLYHTDGTIMNLRNIQWGKIDSKVIYTFLKDFIILLLCLLGIIYFVRYEEQEKDSKVLSRIETLQIQLKKDKIDLDKAQLKYDKTLNTLLMEQNTYINKTKE